MRSSQMDHAAEAAHQQRSSGGAMWRDPVVVLLAVVALVLRLWGLGTQSLWYDEWLTALAADGGLGHLYRYVTQQAGIPPTFFGMEWLWAQVAGTSEWALRLPSAVAGIVLVPVVAIAARAWGSSRTESRIAALLVAVNPMLIWYSQEARPYSLVALATGVTLVFLPRWIDGGRRIDLGAWALAAVAAVAFHYYTIFLVLLEVAYLVWRRRPGRSELVAVVPAAVGALVLLPFAVDQTGRRDNHAWIGDWPLRFRATEAVQSAVVGPGGVAKVVLVIGLVAGGALLAIATAACWVDPSSEAEDRDRSATAPFVLVAFGVGAVGLAWIVAVAGVDGFLSRYLIGSVVAICIALPTARRVRWARPVATIALVALVLVGLVGAVAVQRDPSRQRAQWAAVAATYRAATGPGSSILLIDRGISIAEPITRYLTDRRVVGNDETVTVSDIDVLSLPAAIDHCDWFVGQACALLFLGRPLPPSVAGAFKEVERVPVGSFVLVRYRADQPTPVKVADLAAGLPAIVVE